MDTPKVSTQQEFKDLPVGRTIVESLLFGQYTKIGSNSWSKVGIQTHSKNTIDNYDLANLSLRTNAPFTVVSTPEE